MGTMSYSNLRDCCRQAWCWEKLLPLALDMAEKLKTTQSSISRLEHQADMYLSTCVNM